MFIDASALVAILSEEEGAKALSTRIELAEKPFTSPIAVFETISALLRKKQERFETIAADLRAFLEGASIDVMPIANHLGFEAAEVQTRFGKRSGHPARLNLGDCFAYAIAKQHGVPLLYKGDDFSQTDLA
jgi:ribonuclease VapC